MARSSKPKISSRSARTSTVRREDEEAAHGVEPNRFRLGYLIHDVSRMRRTLCDQRMKSDGITRSQWWVLANLSRHGADGITNIELARLLDVGKVTLGRLITRLETSGYVYRRPDKYDRRAKHIFITNAGYGLIERMSLIMEGLNREISADLTAAETAAMENNLARMKDTLRGLLADVHGPDPEEQGD